MWYRFLVVAFICLLISCGQETLPKPKGYLSLEYPESTYEKLRLERPYSFEVSKQATIKDVPENWLKISYSKQKASLDITYRPVQNNLQELLVEAERLVFKHTVKAENITSRNYEDSEKQVFGTIYEITGNSASHLQFHLTDSVQHFIKASLYFNSRPNYDSILPAVAYLKKDITRLIETFQWSKQP